MILQAFHQKFEISLQSEFRYADDIHEFDLIEAGCCDCQLNRTHKWNYLLIFQISILQSIILRFEQNLETYIKQQSKSSIANKYQLSFCFYCNIYDLMKRQGSKQPFFRVPTEKRPKQDPDYLACFQSIGKRLQQMTILMEQMNYNISSMASVVLKYGDEKRRKRRLIKTEMEQHKQSVQESARKTLNERQKTPNIVLNTSQIHQESQIFHNSVTHNNLQAPKVEKVYLDHNDSKMKDFPSCLSVIPPTQSIQIVDMKELLQPNNSKSSIQNSLSKWTGKIYDKISEAAFLGYFSRYLSEDQTKVYLAKSLLVNFARMTECLSQFAPKIWKENRIYLIKYFETESLNALQYLGLKYPQQQKTYVSQEIRKAIPKLDNSMDPSLNYFVSTGLFFELKEKQIQKKYHKIIKQFINNIIDLSNQHAKTWKRLMKEIFTIDGAQLHNQVGIKLKQNTPKYTSAEIQQPGVQFKAPQILRIIVKWAEQLEKTIQNLNEGTILKCVFSTRKKKFDVMNTIQKSSNFRNDLLLDQSKKSMRSSIQTLMSLLPEFLGKYEKDFIYIDPNDTKCGLLSYCISQAASSAVIDYLVKLIEMLKKASNTILKSCDGQDQFQFVTFTISDLLRSKCVGSIEQIKKVYAKLADPNGPFEVYRVKNRIDTGNKDFLVNCKLKGTPMLCEMQLKILEKVGDEKQDFFGNFNHILYELIRASYGPIAEAAMINNSLTDLVPFFKKQMGKVKEKQAKLTNIKIDTTRLQEGEVILQNFIFRPERKMSFICSNCLTFRLSYNGHLGYYEKKQRIKKSDQIQNQWINNEELDLFSQQQAIPIRELQKFETYENNNIICGQCVYHSLDMQQRGIYLLGNNLGRFFYQISQINNQNSRKYICAVKKETAIRQISILQNVNSAFFPTFHSLKKTIDPSEMLFKPKDLQENYYLFRVRKNTIILEGQKSEDIQSKKESLKEIGLIKQNKIESHQEQEILVGLEYSFENDMDDGVNNKSQQKQLAKQSIKFGDLMLENILVKTLYNKSAPFPQNLKIKNIKFIQKQRNDSLDLSEMKRYYFLYNQNYQDLLLINGMKEIFQNLNSYALRNEKISAVQKQSMKTSLKWYLVSQYIDNFTIQTFEKCNLKVQKIDLRQNNIRYFPILSAPELRQLNLKQNFLSQLKLEESDYPKLQQLDLSFNQIRQVKKIWKAYMKKINLKSNRIQQLNQGQWNVPVLQEIDLSSNQITHLSFSSLKNCKHIALGNNKEVNPLQTVQFPQQMFELLELNFNNFSIKFLDLSKTFLPKLKLISTVKSLLEIVKLPSSLPKLKQLNLKQSKLKKLDLPLEIPKLQIIDLSNNLLNEICLSKSLPSLTKLNLAKNQFKSFQLQEHNFPNLREINIDSNKLTEMHLPPISDLRVISLENNRLQQFTLPNQTTKLSQLSIGANSLDVINLPKSLPFLQILTCSQNKLKLLDFSDYQYPALQKIKLDNNLLEEVRLPSELPNLSQFSATKCKIRLIKMPKNLHKIQFLRLSCNSIQSIELPQRLLTLQVVQLSQNKIKSLKLSTHSMPALSQLKISQNPLQKIELPSQLPSLLSFTIDRTNIKSLNLPLFPKSTQILITGNLLQSLNLNQPNLKNTIKISLRNNRLTRLILPSELLNLQQLDLSQNYLKTLDLSNIKLPKLKTLKCYENQLETIVWNLSLVSINEIRFSRNRLQKVDFANLLIDKLTIIQFNLNKITNITLPSNLVNLKRCSFACNLFQENKQIRQIRKYHVGSGLLPLCLTAVWLLSLLSEADFILIIQEASRLASRKILPEHFIERIKRNNYPEKYITNISKKDSKQVIKAIISLDKIPKGVLKTNLQQLIQADHAVCDQHHTLHQLKGSECNDQTCVACGLDVKQDGKLYYCSECCYGICLQCIGSE